MALRPILSEEIEDEPDDEILVGRLALGHEQGQRGERGVGRSQLAIGANEGIVPPQILEKQRGRGPLVPSVSGWSLTTK